MKLDRFGQAKSILTLLAVSSMGIFAPGAVNASVAPAPQYLYFNAQCSDCALAANVSGFNVLATLELDGYNYGDPLVNGTFLQNGNVISFSYSGSNLVSPFHTVAQRAGEKAPPGGITTISGQINTGEDWPAPSDGALDISFANDQRFTISNNGDWAYFAGSDLPNDFGHGVWSLTAGPVGVQAEQQIPEPGSLALFGLGFVAALLVYLFRCQGQLSINNRANGVAPRTENRTKIGVWPHLVFLKLFHPSEGDCNARNL